MTKDLCRAAVLYTPENLFIEDIPAPTISPDEVLIQVKACGLCGSDLHAYMGKHPRATFPRILGHEFAGVIAQKGEKVSRWEIGQRVCCGVNIPCGECDLCRQGRKSLCVNLKTLGFNIDGAYCEFVKLPMENLYLLPDSVSFEEASMVQNLTVAYNAVKRRGEVKVQDRVLIFGCGPVGLSALAVAKASGAKVWMVDTLDYRLEVARAMGADQTFNAAQVDVVRSILDLTQGRGMDKVFEVVGGEQDVTLSQATQVVKRAGLIVVVGTFSHNRATLRITDLKDREIELRGGGRGNQDIWPDCVELMVSGKLHLEKMISHRLKLEDVEIGLKLMNAKEENVLKVIINP